jgi:putative ABC transport system substrate-binding protein
MKVGSCPLSVVSVIFGAMFFTLGASAEAQQATKIPRIGVLAAGSNFPASPSDEALLQGLRELGYIEGQNIGIVYRFAEGKVERFADLAAELVHLKVEIIVATGTPAVLAAKQATRTIPIVMASTGDPVASGLVVSLAHPGGNVTGLSNQLSDVGGKQLEILNEAFPKVARVAVLWDPTNAANALWLGEVKAAAGRLRITLQPLEVHVSNDIETAFAAIIRDRATALSVAPNTVNAIFLKQILNLAAKSRLPVIYPDSRFTDAGGLMSYGANIPDLFRRAATYVDKILRGAKPGDLPVEQPTKFELVINLKAAKEIGLTIPPNVLARADRVIK